IIRRQCDNSAALPKRPFAYSDAPNWTGTAPAWARFANRPLGPSRAKITMQKQRLEYGYAVYPGGRSAKARIVKLAHLLARLGLRRRYAHQCERRKQQYALHHCPPV